MIRLNRDTKPPEVFESAELKDEVARLESFYSASPNERAQRTYTVNWRLRQKFLPSLVEMSHGKCAYCETSFVGETAAHCESFRPKSDAMSLDGTVSPDHYWWLVYDWSNLFAACVNCNRLKGRRFPVMATRAPLRATGAALDAEQPYLINPCVEDPSDHLVFSEDGPVAGRTERGRITIEVLGLNRESLVLGRREALAELRASLEMLTSVADATQEIERLTSESRPYVAACRQYITQWMRELEQRTAQVNVDPKVIEKAARFEVSPDEQRSSFEKFSAEQTVQEAYSVASDAQKEHYYIRTRFIERIEIANFRPIADLTLRFNTERAVTAPVTSDKEAEDAIAHQASWLMLLGENAVGKSSALQAVALCLLGEDWRNRAGLDARRFLRIGTDRGSVRVFLTGSNEPIELGFSNTSSEFTTNQVEPKLLILGYGSTRLLPRSGMTFEAHAFANSDNLFNPFVPLGDASEWLLKLDDGGFEKVATALKILLELKEKDRLVRELSPIARVEADIAGVRVPLEELSDGFQSVLALTCDVMRVMLSRWPSMESAEGIVILDEIGSHLHPSWRMKVVGSMRRVFPRVQFLASTHDPLCLRGLDAGEVAVMRRNSRNEVIAITEGLPNPRGLRVDQLLTSEFFGLNSSIDPELDKLFSEYYGILANPNPTDPERERAQELKSKLDEFRVLGATRRERLMLEVIDKYLAEEPDISDAELREVLTETTKAQVRAIWDAVQPTA